MFCLFLGLSLSFLTAQTVNRGLQCWRFTAAFREWLAIKPILEYYTFLIPWEVVTLAEPQDLLNHLWHTQTKGDKIRSQNLR